MERVQTPRRAVCRQGTEPRGADRSIIGTAGRTARGRWTDRDVVGDLRVDLATCNCRETLFGFTRRHPPPTRSNDGGGSTANNITVVKRRLRCAWRKCVMMCSILQRSCSCSCSSMLPLSNHTLMRRGFGRPTPTLATFTTPPCPFLDQFCEPRPSSGTTPSPRTAWSLQIPQA